MAIARRQFLLLAGSQVFPFFSLRSPVWASNTPRPLLLLFRGMDKDTPVDLVRAFVEPFVEASIPFGFVLDQMGISDTRAIDPALARMWAELTTHSPSLAEWVVGVPDLGDLEPYFQRRAISEAIHDTAATLSRAIGRDFSPLPPLTVAYTSETGIRKYDSLQAFGMRNVIELGRGSEFAESDTCTESIACLSGSVRVGFGTDLSDIENWVKRRATGGRVLLLEHSMYSISDHSAFDIRHRAEIIAAAIVDEVQGERAFVVAPREHANWFLNTSEQKIAVMVAEPAEDDLTVLAGFQAMLRKLEEAGIAYAIAGSSNSAFASDPAFCLRLDANAAAADRKLIAEAAARAETTCAIADTDEVASYTLAGSGLSVLLRRGAKTLPRFDADGLFQRGGVVSINELANSSRSGTGVDIARGSIVLVDAAETASPERRAEVISLLTSVRAQPKVSFVSLPRLLNESARHDPVFEIYQLSRATEETAEQPDQSERESKAALLADARLAWSYIEKTTVEATGLCPATVHFLPDGNWQYRQLTMWDFASLIQGVLAAHEIGLIDDFELAQRSDLLVGALPTVRINGLRLPSASISIDRRTSLSRDFNVCDTGRLLSALWDLASRPGAAGAVLLRNTVESWDLEGVVIDGHLHSVRDGRPTNRSQSHCAHYAALGFRLWGVDAWSPYESAKGLVGADADMRLLYDAADIGAIGAEPLLLEAIEYGLTPPSKLLAQVLRAAQLRAYKDTGQLYCVSESPLNRAPWFTYQGLRIGDRNKRWDVRTISLEPGHHGDAFAESTMLVNSKAAFLWHAVRRDAYSNLLHSHVREKARNPAGGFNPGIFTATGQTMENYSDVNTNSIILQAIAHIWRGRQPRQR